MQKYVIERDLPGAGRLSAAQLNAASKKSREVLASMGANVQWVQSYVTDDKIYCVYLAHSEDEHPQSRQGGRAPRHPHLARQDDPRSDQRQLTRVGSATDSRRGPALTGARALPCSVQLSGEICV